MLFLKKNGNFTTNEHEDIFMKKLFPILCVLMLILTISHCFAQIKTQEAKLTDLPANACLACRGDVSPSTMKLIMYEGDKKYAVRGTCKIVMGDESYGGEMNMDANFKNGLQVFREYAQKKWKGFEKEF